ncbi:MAG TPA: ferrous iron transporter B [Blastocatellia bacterium]|nr:ferrous iron transporter B [Blastocatellia bacterium]
MPVATAEHRTITPSSTDQPLVATRKLKLLLVGNPNVGKSVIFGWLTGKYVTVSNYPGTTVEVSRGGMRYGGRDWEVIDTPGVNSLVPQSDDERVTRDLLINAEPDLIVQVADAKNLRRTLLVTAQLAQFGVPMLLVLNLMDEARSRNIEIDAAAISELFGIPVVETVATDGEGLDKLHKLLGRAKVPKDPLREKYHQILTGEALRGTAVENGTAGMPLPLAIEWLQTRDTGLRAAIEQALGNNSNGSANHIADAGSRLRLRTLTARLEETRNGFLDEAVAKYKKVLPGVAADAQESFSLKLAFAALAAGITLFLYTEVARRSGWPNPYDAANGWIEGSLIPAAQAFFARLHLGRLFTLLFGTFNEESKAWENGFLYPLVTQLGLLIAPVMTPFALVIHRSKSFAEKLGAWSRDWKTGVPVLFVVLLLMYEFVGVIGAGTLVDAIENNVFNGLLNPAFQAIIPSGFIYDFLVGQYGLISVGLTYGLAIVLPIVTTFFIAFGLLEDSGYLPRLAILSDRGFRFMGLNGKAVLPMVLGLGCDTMATMTTRILATKKERLIATILLALGVPCSAQLGVILGITGSLSYKAVLIVFGVVVSQMMLVGWLSSKLIKGERGDFIFEIPPIRVPIVKNVWTKTRQRMKWYLKEALPLFVLGTLILFILDRLRVPTPWGTMSGLGLIEGALSPVVTGVLDLPKQTAQVLLLGFLRRDYGAAGLFQMVHDGVLSPVQIVTALVVLTLFIPCIANFFMIVREHGTRKALYILAFITPFAIAVGGAVSWVLRTLHIHF